MNNYSLSRHFGVYGAVISKGKIMCILKKFGPYKNRFDVPGGSQENWEGLTETLCREIIEETGYTVKSYNNPRVYDTFVKESDKLNVVHHIMVFYDVQLDETIDKKDLPTDDWNDSNGICWVAFEEINEKNASPLLLKLKKEYMGTPEFEKSQFLDWHAK